MENNNLFKLLLSDIDRTRRNKDGSELSIEQLYDEPSTTSSLRWVILSPSPLSIKEVFEILPGLTTIYSLRSGPGSDEYISCLVFNKSTRKSVFMKKLLLRDDVGAQEPKIVPYIKEIFILRLTKCAENNEIIDFLKSERSEYMKDDKKENDDDFKFYDLKALFDSGLSPCEIYENNIELCNKFAPYFTFRSNEILIHEKDNSKDEPKKQKKSKNE